MMSFGRRTSLLILGLLAAPVLATTPLSASSQASNCPFHRLALFLKLAQPAKPEALDAEYDDLAKDRTDTQNPKGKVAASKVHVLLNRVFYPMIAHLYEASESLSDDDIQRRALDLREQNPPQVGDYTDHLANVGDRAHPDSQAIINHNARGGNSIFYGLDSLPTSTQKFVFMKPSSDAISQLGAFQKMLGMNLTPTGAYGTELAKEMIMTTQIMIDIARQSLPEMSKAAYTGNVRMITAETTRGMNGVIEEVENGMAPLGAVAEGILTLNQIYALLLMEPVPGAQDGVDALKMLIFNGAGHGLANEFTRRVPIGVTAPSTLKGLGFQHPLEAESDGRLSFSDGLKSRLKTFLGLRRNANTQAGTCPMASIYLGSQSLTAKNSPDSVGSPVEKQKTGIELLSEVYWKIFTQVHVAMKQQQGAF